MWLLTAALTLGAAYAACVALASTVRRRSLALTAAIALPLLVCVEACIVHALSIVRAVGRPGLLVANALVMAAAYLWARRHRPRLRLLPRRIQLGDVAPAGFALLVLAPFILFSALAYPPNNWDSMTYHLGRVAHWIQNRSVAGYPTSIERQLAYPPGAEYLLLALQAIARSDRLGALVQLGLWVVIAAAAPPLARTFGLRRRLAPWAALVAAGGPMAVLQASSTQNDLVAAAIAVGIVAACLPFLHRRRRWNAADVVLAASCVVAGAVTKPTSIVCALPFLAGAAWRVLSALGSRAARMELLRATPVVAVAAAVLIPFAAAARQTSRQPGLFSPYVYAGLSQAGDRLVNSVRGLLRDLPFPVAALDGLAPRHTLGCPQEGSLCLGINLAPGEDCAGNPAPALLLLLGIGAALLRWRRVPGRVRLGVACWLAAWLIFHATFRDNVWITRLQLPLFALAPVALGMLMRPLRTRLGQVAVTLAFAGLAAHAFAAAALNVKRPLAGVVELAPGITRPAGSAAGLAGGGLLSENGYYILGPAGLAATHAAVLQELGRSGCRRFSLFVGGDSWEYPLTWRAMQRGIEVRHLTRTDDAWPCAVFSDRGEPPGLAAAGTSWSSPPGLPSLFLRVVEPGAIVPAAER